MAGPAEGRETLPTAALAAYIDHTLLRPEATRPAIDRLCAEARTHAFHAVCVNPAWVRRAATALEGSDVAVASVVAFPFGATPPRIKAREALGAIDDGAREIDVVMNVGALKGGDDALVLDDVEQVAYACRGAGARLKVIIEAALLDDDEKVRAARLVKQAGADFVKTSTGFGPGGATVDDVRLLRETVGPDMGVKAAGGIRTADDVRAMIAAGATRVGASASVAIMTGGSGGDQY